MALWLSTVLLLACTPEAPQATAKATADPTAMRTSEGDPERAGRMTPPPRLDAMRPLPNGSARAREAAVLDPGADPNAIASVATDDASPAVRLAAVQALADDETPVARAALRRALEDEDPDVVAEAILALGAAGDRKAAPALRRLRTHPDPELRGLAEDALLDLER